MARRATAFVPGHVTGFCSPQPADDPAAAGARGAGIALAHGVEVTVCPGRGVTLDGEATSLEPVDRVLDALDVAAAVEVESALPLEAGFGVTGAAALGTALAANRAFGLARSWNDLVSVAHAAEVEAESGLGDVVAQAHGGVPVRLEPGAPPGTHLDAIPDRARIEYVAFGRRGADEVLWDAPDDVESAGERALTEVETEPTLQEFVAAAQEFAREAGLLTPDVAEAIEAVREAGGLAAMAVPGRTVFALGSGLSDAGYDPEDSEVDPAGARLLAE